LNRLFNELSTPSFKPEEPALTPEEKLTHRDVDQLFQEAINYPELDGEDSVSLTDGSQSESEETYRSVDIGSDSDQERFF
jgi:hypothetical protein